MKSTTRRALGLVALCALLVGTGSPFAASAATKAPVKTVAKAVTKKSKKATIALDLYNPKKKYADEKKDILNPASRCVTTATKAARADDLKNYEADGKKISGIEEPEHPLADDYKKYKLVLDLAWEAMEEPYCGFGAFGTSAAIKSYNKTADRARANFLDAVKKGK